jgi:acyl-CoA synthetase (AMP-forming)/AMP-acid ligase II
MLLIDSFDRGVARNPEGTCFLTADESVRMSYEEVAALSQRIAAALAEEGVEPETRVGVLSPNAPIGFCCVLGALRLNASWVPLNAKATATDLVPLLELTDCEILFYHPALLPLAEAVLEGCDSVRLAVAIEPGGRPGDPRLEDWMAPAGTTVARPPHEPDRTAIMFGTGGTTGRSKAVPITHRMAAAMNLAFAAHMPEPEPPTMAMAAPMTHAAGPICFPVFAEGGTVVVHDGVVPERLLASIERHRISRLFLPPTAIYALLSVPGVRSYDFSSLRHFIYAAAPMAVDKLEEALDVFGPVMTQTFGQAEAPMICTVMTPAEHVAAAADPALRGRLASAGRSSLVAEVAIMDDDGNLVGPEEVGEIVVRGSLVMAGYHKDPEQSQAVRRPGGWHGTSDVGRADADGYVYIVDRKRDMIITGGFNVWPSEIEQVLHTIEGVRDCAVIGLPDEKWGEAVTAVVELREDAPEVEVDAVTALCRERLGPVKSPKQVIFRELPRSPNGKVLKRALRDEYWTGQERSV